MTTIIAVGRADGRNKALALLPKTKLLIEHEADGYTMTDGASAVSVETLGGLASQRRDFDNTSMICDVMWILDRTTYPVLINFYEENFGRPFLMDLIVDQYIPLEHTVQFVPESFGLNQQSGETYIVGAQIEVFPITPDVVYDTSVISLYASFQEETFTFLDAFAIFTNQTMALYL